MPNDILERDLVQFALKVESVEGTAIALAAADAKMRVNRDAVALSDDVEFFQRRIARSTLSRLGSIPGVRGGGASCEIELAGSGSVATASPPSWKDATRCCGFGWSEQKKITIGAITSGPFQHGETVTQATSNATGRVVGRTLTGTTLLYVVVLSGTFDATNVITGGTSGASATPSAVAVGGWEVKPISSSIPTATIGLYMDGKRGRIAGARGNVVLRGRVGEPMMLAFTFLGVHQGEDDQALLSSVSYETTVPPALMAAAAIFHPSGGTTYTPQIHDVEIDLGSQPTLRKSINATYGAFSAVVAKERQASARIDPEMDLVANFDPDGLMNAATDGLVQFSVGTVEGNRFLIVLPACRIVAVANNETDGIRTTSLTLDLTGTDDEICIRVC